MGKLEHKGREADLNITPVLEIPQAKETCAKFSLREDNLNNSL